MTEKVGLFGGEINGRHVGRIQIDSGASRTVVKRSLISPSDIREQSIVVTFGNGISGEYLLAQVRVKIDDEEYCVKAAIVENLAEEVLLGRDVPLHKHMVRWLTRSEQMDLLRQLAKDNEVQLATESENTESVLAVMTRLRRGELNNKKSPWIL